MLMILRSFQRKKTAANHSVALWQESSSLWVNAAPIYRCFFFFWENIFVAKLKPLSDISSNLTSPSINILSIISGGRSERLYQLWEFQLSLWSQIELDFFGRFPVWVEVFNIARNSFSYCMKITQVGETYYLGRWHCGYIKVIKQAKYTVSRTSRR